MKKLLLLLLLSFTFLISSAQTVDQYTTDDVRPYLHWKIDYVKIDNETNEIQKGSLMINTLELEDAISQFRVQCSYCEIRAVARDYYFICGERTYVR